jgi:Fungalysin metallopeptidase (M36)/Bacterial Ig-like domain (group 3)
MSHRRPRLRRLVVLLGQAVIAAGTLVAVQPALPAAAQEASEAAGPAAQAAPDFDIRTAKAPAVRRLAPARTGLAALPGVSVVAGDPGAGPVSLINYGGYLTGPSADSPEAVARAYLAAHPDVFHLDAAGLASLVVDSQATTPANGVTQLVLAQQDAGRAVFGSSLLFSIDAQGRMLTMGGAYYPGLSAAAQPAIPAAAAVTGAASAVGAAPAASLVATSEGEGASRLTTFANTIAEPSVQDPSPLTAALVTFPMGGSVGRLAWEVEIEVSDVGWYQSVVDASTGELLYRRNYYQDDAEGTVSPGESPTVSPRQVVSFTGDPAFDNAGWVSGQTTVGNNVISYQDLNNTNTVGFQPTTPAAPDPNFQHFDFAFANAYGAGDHTDVTTDQAAVVTQEFFYANFYHDYLYRLGFTEAFRNFQADNFGRGGIGADPVLAEADDGFNIGRRNNANFATPPDGRSPRMQMFTFTAPPFAFTDGDMDADVIFHESTHGLSNRLVGGGRLGNGVQTGAMGEGWSDSVAASIDNNAVIGEYVTGNTVRGIRRVAYDNSPLVYTDLCNQGCEVHRDGEIWATVLWDMRTKLIQKYGLDAGKHLHELLLVDGMKSTVTAPSFLQARDGILAADMADTSGANQCLIWSVFAGRRMGLSATSSADQRTVTPGTDVPAACVSTTALASSANPAVFGQTITLTATVAGTGLAGEGTVTFRDGAAPLATARLAGGAATVTTAALAVGDHPVTATYNADGNLAASAGSALQIVNKDATITTVTSSANPGTFGAPVTLTIGVAAAPPGSGTASGTVTVRDGTRTLGTVPLDGSAQARFTTAGLQAGSHVLTAVYGGDGNYLSGVSAPFVEVVRCAATVTGTVVGGLDVTTSTCLSGVTVLGSVTVEPGAALSVTDSRIAGGVSASGATAVTICGGSVAGAVTVTDTSGFVLLGDGSPACAGGSYAGALTVDGSLGQAEVAGNQLSGALSISGSAGAGPDLDHQTATIAGNTVRGALLCSGNAPTPTNGGRPNSVTGAKTGQCSASDF